MAGISAAVSVDVESGCWHATSNDEAQPRSTTEDWKPHRPIRGRETWLSLAFAFYYCSTFERVRDRVRLPQFPVNSTCLSNMIASYSSIGKQHRGRKDANPSTVLDSRQSYVCSCTPCVARKKTARDSGSIWSALLEQQ